MLILLQSLLYLRALRGVAQPGRASALGAECRQFESGYPDTKNAPPGAFYVSKVARSASPKVKPEGQAGK